MLTSEEERQLASERLDRIAASARELAAELELARAHAFWRVPELQQRVEVAIGLLDELGQAAYGELWADQPTHKGASARTRGLAPLPEPFYRHYGNGGQ